ncbi:hypothetical protein FUAX_28140 [Fulvitalea axinellae]|uniref:DUF4199 domain-containing protein n=1 Tax=Fulvitalea axinellae TaxID=1182444 RepID=A0AAU9CTK9_9BACT|nr:hypothetical protein FUAX_28140 [Fulvitalea axinellae]
MVKTAIKYGLVGGAICIALLFGMSLFLENPISESEIPFILILAIFIFSAIRDFKKSLNRGFLKFWQGASIGFIVYMTCSALSGAGVFALSATKPETVQTLLDHQIENWESSKEETIKNRGEEYYNEYLSDLRSADGSSIATAVFIRQIILGIILTFALAMIMKKSEP